MVLFRSGSSFLISLSVKCCNDLRIEPAPTDSVRALLGKGAQASHVRFYLNFICFSNKLMHYSKSQTQGRLCGTVRKVAETQSLCIFPAVALSVLLLHLCL